MDDTNLKTLHFKELPCFKANLSLLKKGIFFKKSLFMYCVLDTTYKKPNLEWLISQIQESKNVTF